MIQHALHVAERAWASMVAATGTSNLGLVVWTFAITFVGWILAVLDKWRTFRKTNRNGPAITGAIKSSARNGLLSLLTIIAVAIGAWCLFILRTINSDHEYWVSAHAADAKKILDAKTALEVHKHSISTTDPVFPNIIYLLQAFAIFRNALHGESCVIKITATPESSPLAMAIGQFSVATSNCPTFGPDSNTWMDPDFGTEARKGMVPDAIVFHAARGDGAANTLFTQLENQIRLQRSYELPKIDYQVPSGGYAHTIWLQFGSNVKWNSELH